MKKYLGLLVFPGMLGMMLWSQGVQISVKPPQPAISKEGTRLQDLSDEFIAISELEKCGAFLDGLIAHCSR